MKMKKKLRKVGHVLIFLAVVAAAVGVIMLLWNALIPSIMGWSAINFWQAGGLLILCKLLFGGLGRHGHHMRHGCGWGRDHKREFGHIHEKMKGMSRSERRDYIREKMARGFSEEDKPMQNDEM